MKRVYRTLTAQLDTSTFRTETLQGREYLVVPCRLMRGGYAISAQGSEFPELVPASELENSAPHWNNRPIMSDHPVDGSANTPEMLEADQLGILFNTTFEDDFLQPEMWFDKDRAAALGGTHQKIIEDIEAGIPTEVSGGTEIQLEIREGIDVAGTEYGGVWRNLKPDHAAVGLNGAKGACDIITGGCGIRTGKEKEVKLTRKDFEDMFRYAQSRNAQDVGKSSNDLRDQLWDALEGSSIENFWSVRDDFQESSTVIYATWDFDGPMRLWRHKFESTESGTTLVGEPEPVVFTSTFLTVSREALTTNDDPVTLRIQGGDTMTEEEIQSLIAGDNQFTVDDQETLAGLPEGFAAKLAPPVLTEEPAIEEPAEEETTEPEAVIVPPGMVLLPEADLAPMQAAAKAHDDQQRAARERHTTTLRSAACCQLTDTDMEAMSVDTLERLVAGLPVKTNDYSGQGAEPPATDAPSTPQPAPRAACFEPHKEVN